jgi:hypothetical protein
MNVEEKVKVNTEIENGVKNEAYECGNLVSSILWRKRLGKTEKKKLCFRTEQTENKKPFRKPERSDVDEALLKWFKQERSGNVPVSGLFSWQFLLICMLMYLLA